MICLIYLNLMNIVRIIEEKSRKPKAVCRQAFGKRIPLLLIAMVALLWSSTFRKPKENRNQFILKM